MKKILIVDDSKYISDILTANIGDSIQCDVTICYTFEETRQILESQADSESEYFAAVLDLNLPDAPNGEVVDFVLKKGIPSIVLTGNLSEKVRDNILSRPIVDYVIKNDMSEIYHVLSLIHRLDKNPAVKILVVDDSSAFRQYTASLLKVHGYQVLEAVDGLDALKILDEHKHKHKHKIMMVLTDYTMPNMDGMELTRAIRKTHSRSELCIIAISSYTKPELSAQFLKSGANDTISKPFFVEEFYSRINNHIEMLEHIALIEDMAVRDQLTGLHNRRYLFDLGNKLFMDAKKQQFPLAVAILDIDFFKKVNDDHSHKVGDLALKAISEQLRLSSRKKDIIIRFGGEEFCLLVVGRDNYHIFFETLRTAVESMELSLPEPEGGILKMTVSIGFTTDLEETIDKSLLKADIALYQGKENGRNQVVDSHDVNSDRAESDLLRTDQRDN
ncbi:MAG: diguanylate cyclase [gamma proteobacterium symbiont of Taylorina sp.]|nr:diguanylate cyclase [gamma proteobacterium symbiont of Taylorina sp.]